MAYFDLVDAPEDPDGDGCGIGCHAPGSTYNLKEEALSGADISTHEEELTANATYADCLECHVSGGDNSIRQDLHVAHMESDNEHAPQSCFGCHEVAEYGPDSPSGEILESGS